METKKKYLSFPKKIAYGTGDLGSNFFYMMITSFALIYMTDAVGLDPGIVGTLIMISKLLDGITDVFFGGLIDKTHSKMGKARPWMFFSGFPLAMCLVLIFAIPSVMAFLLIIFAYAANFTGIVAVSFLRSVTMAFLMGSLNAVVAEVARNNWLKNKVHTEGMMFSCSSIGMKVGGGLGAAVSGWILSLAGYVGSAAEQTPDVMHAIKFTYAGIPFILTVLITICLYFMKVSKENESLAKKGEVK